MDKNSLKRIIVVIPHNTLGDNMIVLSLIENLVSANPQVQFVFFVNKNFTPLYRSIPSLHHCKIKVTRLNPWKYSSHPISGNWWRRSITAWNFLRVALATFPDFKSTLALGPDWMTSSTQDLDLFDSYFTRILSRSFIPSFACRKELKNMRRIDGLDHRQFLREELLSVGLELTRRVVPLIQFSRRSLEVRGFLEKKCVIDSQFILCFKGAGSESRDWTGQNVDFLQKITDEINQKIVIVTAEDREALGSLVNILELISMASLVISNDTGWAHCAIEMHRPLLCISAIKNSDLDSYVKKSLRNVVIRPDAMLEDCEDICVRNYYHCISTISHQRVIQSLGQILATGSY
jgi:ADP-heptose:LPS heptosyltransferase